MDELLTLLKKKFSNKEFSIKDLVPNMPYKRAKLYLMLGNLIKAREVVRISRGIYKLGKAKTMPPPAEITSLSSKLKEKITRRFKFTALSVLLPFAHHTPYNIIYLMYVEKGSADDFKEALLKLKPNFTVLINPKKEDILLLLNEADKNKILAIRENAFFHGKEYGIAYHDTALVDLYFEVTRDKIPFMKSDLKEILKDLILNDLINYSRLMRYAHERKLASDIKAMLLKLSKEIPKSDLYVLRKIS